jgi:hypothetical protein
VWLDVCGSVGSLLRRRNREAVREEVERELGEVCTFRPATVESVRREAVLRLLNDEELDSR